MLEHGSSTVAEPPNKYFFRGAFALFLIGDWRLAIGLAWQAILALIDWSTGYQLMIN
jgi:hypothetical protein